MANPSPSPSPPPDPCEGYVPQCPEPPEEGWPEYCCVEDAECGCAPSENSDCECGEREEEPTRHSIDNDCEQCEWSECPAQSPPGKPGYSSGGKGASNALNQAVSAVKTLQRQLHQPQSRGGCSSGSEPCRVNPSQGNVVFQIKLPSAGSFAARPILTYDSLSVVETEYGFGWVGLYQRSVLPVDNSQAWVRTGTGGAFLYTQKDAEGFYSPPAGARNSLRQLDDGSWVETQPNGFQLRYDPQGRFTSMQDGPGNRWTLMYDGNERIAAITEPVPGQRTSFAYDAAGKIRRIAQPGNRITTFVVDQYGDLVKRITPELCITEYRYDIVHRLKTVIQPEGGRTTYAYDDFSRLTVYTSPAGSRTSYSYAPETTSIQNPLGSRTTLVYDAARHPLVAIDATGARTSYSWANGQLGGAVDANGHRTSFVYTTLPSRRQSLQAIVSPSGARYTYGYDSSGKLTRLTDENGHRTTLLWDASGNRTGLIDAQGGRTTYSYNALGLLTQITDPLG